jgi:amino acid adenylation domain-containing protein
MNEIKPAVLEGVRLSPQQECLWFLQGGEQVGPFLSSCTVMIRGDLDVEALTGAMKEVVERHEILRTSFQRLPGMAVPLQTVGNGREICFLHRDLRASGRREQRQGIGRLSAELSREAAERGAETVLRAALAMLRPRLHLLLLELPALYADTVSLCNLVQDIGQCYGAGSKAGQLPEIQAQYADIAEWQREFLESAEYLEGRKYWQQLARITPEGALPFAGFRGAGDGFDPRSLTSAVSQEALEQITRLSALHEVTPPVVLLACWLILLRRLLERDSAVVGVTYTGRRYEELEMALGLFTRVLPLEFDLSETASFEESLRWCATSLHAHEKWQEYFSWQLFHQSQDDAKRTFPPFGFESRDLPAAFTRGGTRFSINRMESCFDRFDLKLICIRRGGNWLLEFHYDTNALRRQDVWRIAGWFQELLTGALATPKRAVADLDLLGEAERHQILTDLNATTVDFGPAKTLTALFEEQAARTPGSVAIVSQDQQLTFLEVERKARRLSRCLRRAGVGPEVRVCLCVDRSIDMIVGILGILKAGGAYVPVDPAYPESRRLLMLRHARPQVTIAREPLSGPLNECGGELILLSILDREEDPTEDVDVPPVKAAPENLAYVIFTSGSTGDPKGVMVSHRAIVNRLAWMQSVFPITAEDRLLQKTPFSFDASIWEIFLPLITGARLIVAEPGAHQDGTRLIEEIARYGVTILQLVPSILPTFLEQDDLRSQTCSLRRLFCGGEALPASVVEDFFASVDDVQLCNLYGPTEASIDASFHVCSRRLREGIVPIGRPLANMELYVLDRQQRLVPPGLAGELHIGGIGLARGYLERPDLTAERFIPHPWAHPGGGRLYKTGDLARWAPDGTIEFLGRIDQQVKLRGFRIELGEVEATLVRHPDVSAAVVLARGEALADKRLIAYVVPREDSGVSPDDLVSFLAGCLPNYMVPSLILKLPFLPRLPNGKIDRKSLLAFDQVPQGSTISFRAPRTATEEILVHIWCEFLGLDRVGIDDDFFELGGHSLIATRVMTRVRKVFGVELRVRKLFEAPSIAALAMDVEFAMKSTRGFRLPDLVPVSREQALPLSYAQQRLWFLQQLEPESPAYHLPGALRLRGELSVPALEHAVSEITRRHEILRTTFEWRGRGAVQVIQPPAPFNLSWIDLTVVAELRRKLLLDELLQRESRRPFDLVRGPALRLFLVRLGSQEHVLFFNMHHIISDGWSIGVLVRELTLLYEGSWHGETPSLPHLPVQYADFACWQRSWLQGSALEAQLAYWKEKLQGAPEILNLPTDHPVPAVPTYRGGARGQRLPAPLAASLRQLTRSLSATLYMTCLALFKVLLHRYGAGDDIVVGTNVANRHQPEIEDLIGFFVNALVLRTDLSGDPSFLDTVKRVRETILAAFTYQDVPFDKIVEELQPRRDLGVTPLFQVAFDMEHVGEAQTLKLPGLTLDPLSITSGTAKFFLNLTVQENGDDLILLLEYGADVLDGTTILRMLAHLENTLKSVVIDPGSRISALSMMAEAETFQLLHEFDGPARDYPIDVTLHGLFEREAEKEPDRVAAVCGEAKLSYGELNRKANRWARLLRQFGTGPGSFVGILEERGLDFLTAILAILKAGGAYVPLEPGYPRDRLRYMISNSGMPILIARAEFVEELFGETGHSVGLRHVFHTGGPTDVPVAARPGGPAFYNVHQCEGLPDANLTNTGSSGLDPAYMLYTSGSTGLPKGAVIRHEGAVNHIYAEFEALQLDPDLCFLQSASSCSDISVWQFLAPLLIGGRTVIIDQETVSNPGRLLETMQRERVTLAEFVPVVLRCLVEHAANLPAAERALPELRWMMAVGEAVPADLVNAWLAIYPEIGLVDAYGPTEASDDVTQFIVSEPLPDVAYAVPIGKPLANMRCYILDGSMLPVPLKVPGELCIAGVGVGIGYWNAPDKTSTSFVANPFARLRGEVLYKTGDLARWLCDGNLEFLGRADQQVKIRGFRVELGEIEAALREHPSLSESVVVVRGGGADKQLVAYVVPRGGHELKAAELREFLAERLLGHMIPTTYVTLAAMPVAPSGKIDRRALPAPDLFSKAAARDPVAPRTPVEQKLATIWEEVFKLADIGIEADFFEIGGHSLLAIQVLSRVQAAFGVDIPLRKVFEATTIADFAVVVERASQVSGRLKPASIPRVARQRRELEAKDVIARVKGGETQ